MEQIKGERLDECKPPWLIVDESRGVILDFSLQTLNDFL
jgi:hypothetical protein